MTDSTGLTTYGYDTAGQVATISGLGTNVTYTYDPAGNRATMKSATSVPASAYSDLPITPTDSSSPSQL
jgi:YD repeat-containing protein